MKFLTYLVVLFGALVTTASASPSLQDKDAAAHYPVDLEIMYNDRTMGTPRLTLREGQPAVISYEKINGYSLRATLTRKAMNNRLLANLETELYVEQSGKWKKVSTPIIMQPFGGDSSIEVARPGGGQPLLRMRVKIGSAVIAAAKMGKPCDRASYVAWKDAMSKPLVLTPAAATSLQSTPCYQGGYFRCCGQSARCADPHNCKGSCCTFGDSDGIGD